MDSLNFVKMSKLESCCLEKLSDVRPEGLAKHGISSTDDIHDINAKKLHLESVIN